VPAPPESDSGLSSEGRRILEAIDSLPGEEREAFDLVKIQGMTHAEAGELLGVSVRTVKRWVSRSLRLLTDRLGDLGPPQESGDRGQETEVRGQESKDNPLTPDS
jgi:RNA polymerase sigma-70 factor (ECF subfamily)